MFIWFHAKRDFLQYVTRMKSYQLEAERYLSTQHEVYGYCTACQKVKPFKVNGGVYFGALPNLREGLVCECGLSNRNRLIYSAMRLEREGKGDARMAILERTSVLYRRLQKAYPEIIGTEYLGKGAEGGTLHTVAGIPVRHESITELSFPSGSLDVIAHNDVLEHVFDYRKALAELYRVLKRSGSLIFTCPFFFMLEREIQKARILADGSIEFLMEPEYHGDPINPQGALTFYHYGWGLLDDLIQCGFRDVGVGVFYDVFSGFVSNNHPDYEYGNMLPLIIRAEK
jgi:SAM-dependent methyltransferase